MTLALQARARQIRERAVIRAWEYRQRHHSKGVWYRLRRVLVDAAQAFAISPEEANQLEAAGLVSLAVGTEFEPKKRIFLVNEQQLAQLSSRRRLPLTLRAELLESRDLALVPHSEGA